MNAIDIRDWQFGLMLWNERLKLYEAKVGWTPGIIIDLWIYTHGAELNTIIERSRNIFNSLRKRKDEYPPLAAQKLLDPYNDVFDDLNDKPEEWPFDAQYLINHMTLISVAIDLNGESELDYNSDGGPLVRVTVSPDLSFKDALFD